jgi:adenine-specific DNA methylase
MIPQECKRLAEVDFPIAIVSKHAAREKSGPKGHPSTLHLWWARRPLAACRAMLMALLLPDPCDAKCPQGFKEKARSLLSKVQGQPKRNDAALREELLRFIGDFANWDLAANVQYIEVAKGLVRACHDDEPPLVVDPFAGGGSIPLEALRLGCETFAADLNPVACLILKVMLDDIPRHGRELSEEIQRAGQEIKEITQRELAEFYPQDADGSRPIAYLWARTVRCESPNCGAEIPLIRSFWLSKKGKRRRALKPTVRSPKGITPQIEFEIFEPRSESEVQQGTVSRAKARCLACNTVLSPDRVRAQLADQRGGADVRFDTQGRRVDGARLLAVITIRDDERGRQYRLPTEGDYQAVFKASRRLKQVVAVPLLNDLSPVPDEPLPPIGTLGFRVQRYGMLQWGDLFSARQKLALITWRSSMEKKGHGQTGSKPSGALALALSRVTMCGMSLTNWNAFAEKMQHTFGRQALPLVWDFAEVVSLEHAPGAWQNACDLVEDVVSAWPAKSISAQVEIADAASSPLPDAAARLWFTDPPYYDAIPYADLSDFFFVWLKRLLPGHPLLRDPFDPDNKLTPKAQEAVQDNTKEIDGKPKDREFFEKAMGRAFAEGRRVLQDDGIACVVFAHKTTEGWEALLSGMITGGWTITGSWPIATEMGSRLRARESAALATSVHLVCRPRPENASAGDWADVLGELPKRVGDWMKRLQSEGVRGADLVFACIGPALEIFSRYSKVETAEGDEVKLAEFLEKVWEVVGKSALAQVLGPSEGKAETGAAGALEEDARLTALFLWTLQSTNGGNGNSSGDEEAGESDDAEEDDDIPRSRAKGFSLIFDVARRFAQPLGIHLPDWEGRIIETEKGVVRLLPVSERAKQLFGDEGADIVADQLERGSKTAPQLALFPDREESVTVKGRGRSKASSTIVSDESLRTRREATTLDRVHAAMLLQKAGRANALRTLLKAEQDRSPDFLRLANALSALYPKSSEEKRLIDAMLLAVPR